MITPHRSHIRVCRVAGALLVPVLFACSAESASGGGDLESDSEVEENAWLGEGKSDDPCPPFHVGVNFAWEHFGADFGGLEAWNQPGVEDNASVVRSRLEAARDAGATVVRWWLWPDFRGDGVMFDAEGSPVGLTDRALMDLDAALRIADEVGIDLMLCFFSFDAFNSAASELQVGHAVPNLADIARDPDKRQALVAHVVTAVAVRVEASPHGHRMVAWDVMNEPEWAIRGSNPYGDPAYTPMPELTAVDHDVMERLLGEMVDALHAVNAGTPVSVGAAAYKWSQAWSRLDTDFHQFHMYDWIDAHWPHDEAPAAFGLDDKPLFIGEIHFTGLEDVSFAEAASSWRELGLLGAMAWSLTDPGELGAAGGLGEVRLAVDAVRCE